MKAWIPVASRNLKRIPALAWVGVVVFLGLALSEAFPPAKWIALLPAAAFMFKWFVETVFGLLQVFLGLLLGLLGCLILLLAKLVELVERIFRPDCGSTIIEVSVE